MNRWSIRFFSLFGVAVIWAGLHFALMMYSGTEIANKEIFGLDQEQVHKKKFAAAARHDPASYQQFSVQLSPDMNSVGLYLGAEHLKTSQGRSEFTIEICSAAGEIVHALPARIKHARKRSSNNSGSLKGTTKTLRHVATIEIAHPDNYKIRVVPNGKQGLPITALNLKVRRNVWIPPFANLAGAFFLGFFSMLGGIFAALAGAARKRASFTVSLTTPVGRVAKLVRRIRP